MEVNKKYKYPLVIDKRLEKPIKAKAKENNLSINQVIQLAIQFYLSGQKIIR